MEFELTNEQRKYLGLEPVGISWDLVELSKGYYLYFDGDIVRKYIAIEDDTYYEREMNETTDENRKILLPKTARGRSKKLTLATMQARPCFGVYFYFGKYGPTIANYTTQTIYFACDDRQYGGINGLRNWLETWIAESTEEDLADIEYFKNAERRHCKFREGDFFSFKIGRREYGFGRILLDISKLKKSEDFKKQKHHGLSFMGRPLFVKVYHKISDLPETEIDAFSGCMAFPSQQILDNNFYYGEYKIIGHKELTTDELEFPISYGPSIDVRDRNTVFLQYGLIYREKNITECSEFSNNKSSEDMGSIIETDIYLNNSIGYNLDIVSDMPAMRRCIMEGSNAAWWESNRIYTIKHDMRNPALYHVKQAVFELFGLDADADYSENLKKVT